MQLKDHLQRCLEKLGTFFRLTVQHGAPIAFMKVTQRPYREVAGLEGMPYVCLRVPTGGGRHGSLETSRRLFHHGGRQGPRPGHARFVPERRYG
jgi:hypothetical protein